MITKELGTSYFKFDNFGNLELSLEPFILHRRKEKSRVLFIFDSVEFGASGAFHLSIAHYDVIHRGEAAQL